MTNSPFLYGGLNPCDICHRARRNACALGSAQRPTLQCRDIEFLVYPESIAADERDLKQSFAIFCFASGQGIYLINFLNCTRPVPFISSKQVILR